MGGFSVSLSFCSTWNRPRVLVVETGAPVENAVETGAGTLPFFKGSSATEVAAEPAGSSKLLNLQGLFVFASS